MYIRNITINNKDFNLSSGRKKKVKVAKEAQLSSGKVREIKFPEEKKKAQLRKSPKKRNFNQSLCITKFNFPPLLSPAAKGFDTLNSPQFNHLPAPQLAAANSKPAGAFTKQQERTGRG